MCGILVADFAYGVEMCQQVKMGQIAAVLKALSCQDCARYVLNSAESDCSCSQCCQCHLETKEVAIPDDDSEYSVEVEGCCEARKQ